MSLLFFLGFLIACFTDLSTASEVNVSPKFEILNRSPESSISISESTEPDWEHQNVESGNIDYVPYENKNRELQSSFQNRIQSKIQSFKRYIFGSFFVLFLSSICCLSFAYLSIVTFLTILMMLTDIKVIDGFHF